MRNNIRLSGKRIGRPPKDPEIKAAYKQQLCADQQKRNEAEGCFGSGKWKYSLDWIMARLSKGAETSISMAFIEMYVEKIWRLLRLSISVFYAWIHTCQREAAFGQLSSTFGVFSQQNYYSLHNQTGNLPALLVLAQNRKGLLFVFQESLNNRPRNRNNLA